MSRMDAARERLLIDVYAHPGASLTTAEKAASGFMLVTDESQPVDDATLASDIDEMRAELTARGVAL